MPKHPAYYDSQAVAAASENVDIYEIREAKREGCPAFRSGRVYRDELLAWLEEKKLKRIYSASLHSDEGKNRQLVIVSLLHSVRWLRINARTPHKANTSRFITFRRPFDAFAAFTAPWDESTGAISSTAVYLVSLASR
jgi:hypothetical protein